MEMGALLSMPCRAGGWTPRARAAPRDWHETIRLAPPRVGDDGAADVRPWRLAVTRTPSICSSCAERVDGLKTIAERINRPGRI